MAVMRAAPWRMHVRLPPMHGEVQSSVLGLACGCLPADALFMGVLKYVEPDPTIIKAWIMPGGWGGMTWQGRGKGGGIIKAWIMPGGWGGMTWQGRARSWRVGRE
jgi:hypothetical protein